VLECAACEAGSYSVKETRVNTERMLVGQVHLKRVRSWDNSSGEGLPEDPVAG
jgi:hypothetical protein